MQYVDDWARADRQLSCLNHAEVKNAAADELKRKLERAYGRMAQCGAHSVVDGIWDVPAGLDDINARVRRGERP